MMRYLFLLLPLIWLPGCDSSTPTAERLVVDLGAAEGCDATLQPCQLSGDGIALRLELAKNIRMLQPFRMQLHVAGVETYAIEAVEVEFFMEGMEMGVNRYRLLPGASGWQGEITLPVCVAGRSDWRAVAEVRTRERLYRARFRFHSSG